MSFPLSDQSKVEVTSLIDALIEHLDAEAMLLTEAESTLNGVHHAILQRSQEDLQQHIARQTALAERIAQAATRRQQLRGRFSRQLGLPLEAVTISRLIRFAEPAQTEQLQSAAQRLGSLARIIDQLSSQNAQLARQQMDLFQRLLDCLTGSESGTPRYQANGDAESSQRPSVIEMRC